MTRPLSLAVLAVSLFAGTAVAGPDPAARQLEALHKGARCDEARPPHRYLCPAAAFATGTAADLPRGKVLFGFGVPLEDGKPVAEQIQAKLRPVFFVVDDKGMVKLTDITPDNDKEKEMILKLTLELAGVLKGVQATAKVPADIATFAKSGKGKYAATKTGGEWTWQGANPSRARKVGNVWIVLEQPAGGLWVNVLTDAWQ